MDIQTRRFSRVASHGVQGRLLALIAGVGLALAACGSPSGFKEREDATARKDTSGDGKDQPGGAGGPIGNDGDLKTGNPNEPSLDSRTPFVDPDDPNLPPPPPPPLVPMGLLVNDLQCALCHWQIRGDISSTRDVPASWDTSRAKVFGSWLAADKWGLDPKKVIVTDGVKEYFKGAPLPVNETFPDLNFPAIAGAMQGYVKRTVGKDESVLADKVVEGNLVLIGTDESPIQLKRDILVKGDVIIAGVYTGTGTIYALGNIYVPSDLKAKRTAFPFSDDRAAADARAKQWVKEGGSDALGLATQKSILIGDLDSGIYEHPNTPASSQRAAIGVDHVYQWYNDGVAGAKAKYAALYGKSWNCHSGRAESLKSVNLVEAFLYAKKTIAGIARQGSVMIRGGIMADNLHIIAGAGNHENTVNCPATPSPVHGRPQNDNYIDYDYRLRNGLQILEQLAPFFHKAEAK